MDRVGSWSQLDPSQNNQGEREDTGVYKSCVHTLGGLGTKGADVVSVAPSREEDLVKLGRTRSFPNP